MPSVSTMSQLEAKGFTDLAPPSNLVINRVGDKGIPSRPQAPSLSGQTNRLRLPASNVTPPRSCLDGRGASKDAACHV